MSLDSYDSPTFLGQKDKHMLGLTLPQVMISAGLAGLWFLVLLAFPMATMMRLSIFLPVQGVIMAFLFARVAGLSFPMYLLLAFQALFSRPQFEVDAERLINGLPEWRDPHLNQGFRGRTMEMIRHQKRRQGDVVVVEKRSEMEAEVNRQISDGAMATKEWAQDSLKALLKG